MTAAETLALAVGAGVVLIVVIVMLLIRRDNRRQAARLRLRVEQQQRQMERLGDALDHLSELTGEVTQRQDRLRDAVDASLRDMRESSGAQMERVNQRLDGRLSAVNRQLEDVSRGLGEMHELADGFGDLKKVLGGVKTRGIWGEVQLGALLQEVLPRGQFVENAAIPAGSQTRVEFAVCVPTQDGQALLPIDSKFPQEDFLRLAEAQADGDAARVERCAARLEKALTEQAKLISEKYIRPPQTVDFAVMFLPVESLYAEAARRAGLCESLQRRYRVLTAGPNTLSALLVSLRLGFKTIRVQERSVEVMRALGALREEFDRYEEAEAQARRRLDQAAEAMDALGARTRKLGRALRALDDLREDAPEGDRAE